MTELLTPLSDPSYLVTTVSSQSSPNSTAILAKQLAQQIHDHCLAVLTHENTETPTQDNASQANTNLATTTQANANLETTTQASPNLATPTNSVIGINKEASNQQALPVESLETKQTSQTKKIRYILGGINLKTFYNTPSLSQPEPSLEDPNLTISPKASNPSHIDQTQSIQTDLAVTLDSDDYNKPDNQTSFNEQLIADYPDSQLVKYIDRLDPAKMKAADDVYITKSTLRFIKLQTTIRQTLVSNAILTQEEKDQQLTSLNEYVRKQLADIYNEAAKEYNNEHQVVNESQFTEQTADSVVNMPPIIFRSDLIARAKQAKDLAVTKKEDNIQIISSVAKFIELQTTIRQTLASYADLTQEEKAQKLIDLNKYVRKQLVDIYNSYATSRYNGLNEVVNGMNFAAYTAPYVASISPIIFRSDLIARAKQAKHPRLYDLTNQKLKTTRLIEADVYLNSLIHELSKKLAQDSLSIDKIIKDKNLAMSPDSLDQLSTGVKTLYELFKYTAPSESYIELARQFYDSDLTKAYTHLSLIFKEQDQTITSWQQFPGSVNEYYLIRHLLKHYQVDQHKPDDLSLYKFIASKLFNKDMKKAYELLSSVAKMSNLSMPDWQQFPGTTVDYEKLEEYLRDIQEQINNDSLNGITEYKNFAIEHTNGDMFKAYKLLSSVAKMSNLSMPDWQQFLGTTVDYEKLEEYLRDIQEQINNDSLNGITEYKNFAIEHTNGDMFKAYKLLSSVAKMSNLSMPDWQQFLGTTVDYEKLEEYLRDIQEQINNDSLNGINEYKNFAIEHTNGNMKKAYELLSSVAKMSNLSMPDWQQFPGTIVKYKDIEEYLINIQEQINNDSLNGITEYKKFAIEHTNGNMKKAYELLSSVAKMSNLSMPDWQAFPGTIKDYVKFEGYLRDHQDSLKGITGYKNFADKHTNGDMLKAYLLLASVAKMSKLCMPDWQQFPGTIVKYKDIEEYLRNIQEKMNNASSGTVFDYDAFARKFTKGNIERACRLFNCVTKMSNISSIR